jgi:hypothetical protein
MGALLNRVRLSLRSNPGTGALPLGPALIRYRTILEAGGADGKQYSYSVEEGDTKAECGAAIYDAATDTLTRVVIYDSTAGYGIAENFSQNATVAITLLAEDIDDLEKRAANKAMGLALVMGS